MSKITSPAVILNSPQLAENIGAVARVMANFGLSELRLVSPRDGWPQERAWASASGADWPLNDAKVFTTLAEALGDLELVLATTARPREARLPVITPRQAAQRLSLECGAGRRTGLLFGAERAGLTADDIAICQAIVTMPVDARFRSLNLAQAVAIAAYEWRCAQSPDAPPAFRAPPPVADQAALHDFYHQLEAELDAAGFFHPPEKRASMVRNLRAAFGRSGLSDQEVRTLRGVVTALAKGRGRVLAKLAAKAAAVSHPAGNDLDENSL
jgi:tRNA/rRNA methyltransferase